MKDEKYGRCPIAKSRNPFTCGLTGKTHTTIEFFQRVDYLARALGKRMGWKPNEETPWDKVLNIFSVNTVCVPCGRPLLTPPQRRERNGYVLTPPQIDYIGAAYAVHRFSGIVTPANAAYSVPELAHQLKSSGAKGIFTCVPLLGTALEAAKDAGIPKDKVFILGMPGFPKKEGFTSLEDLIQEGKNLPEIEPLRWFKGQGARQPAFLCYSSGTSGLPVRRIRSMTAPPPSGGQR